MVSENLNKFQIAAAVLVADKIFIDYTLAEEEEFVEPENFVEEWIAEYIVDSSPTMRKRIWEHFLKRLFVHRERK